MLSEILSIVIGVFFVYLLLSLICSTLVEWLSKVVALRARTLKKWMRRLLRDTDEKGLTERIYKHPLIDVLTPEGRYGKPSYIPPDLFALALTEIVIGQDKASKILTTKGLRDAIAASGCSCETKQALDAVIRGAGEKIESAYAALGRWFDDPMGMVSKAYKNMTAQLVFIVAVAATLLLNLDTISISRTLWKHCDLRAKVEVEAAAFAQSREAVDSTATADPAKAFFKSADQLSNLGIPLGWSRDSKDDRSLPHGFQGWLLKVLGLSATVVAASLGAPFWFDMLQRLIGLRQGRPAA
jgi:hypothetical protein